MAFTFNPSSRHSIRNPYMSYNVFKLNSLTSSKYEFKHISTKHKQTLISVSTTLSLDSTPNTFPQNTSKQNTSKFLSQFTSHILLIITSSHTGPHLSLTPVLEGDQPLLCGQCCVLSIIEWGWLCHYSCCWAAASQIVNQIACIIKQQHTFLTCLANFKMIFLGENPNRI